MKEVFVAREAEMAHGDRRIVINDGVEIGVFRVDDEIFAWRNQCPHQGGPVCQGKLMRGVEERLDADRQSLGIHFREGSMHLVCPWHGFEFDARTGRHAGVNSVGLTSYPVTRRDGDIYVVVRG